jgi:hypothetical protein
MLGTLNALGLLLVVGLTVWVLVKFPSHAKSFLKVLGALLSGFGVIILCLTFTMHFCHRGEPFAQSLISGLCLILVMIFTRRNIITVASALVIVLLAFALSFHFVNIVHEDGYTGNPKRVNQSWHAEQESKARELDAAMGLCVQKSHDSVSYPAAWFTDLPVQKGIMHYMPDYETIESFSHTHNVIAYPLWHSWLTGIYGRRMTDVYLWYPGGTVAQAIGHLEYRERRP